MAYTVKRVVRDRLVNDATFRGFFTGVSTTATAPVWPVFMELTGRYPQVVYSETPGNTDAGMSACNASVTFMIEAQATGGVHPHTTIERIDERINQLFDDQNVTGLGISGTSVYCFLSLREGGTEVSYIPERKVYQKFTTYSFKTIKY